VTGIRQSILFRPATSLLFRDLEPIHASKTAHRHELESLYPFVQSLTHGRLLTSVLGLPWEAILGGTFFSINLDGHSHGNLINEADRIPVGQADAPMAGRAANRLRAIRTRSRMAGHWARGWCCRFSNCPDSGLGFSFPDEGRISVITLRNKI